MFWKIKWDERVVKDLKKIHKSFQQQIIQYMKDIALLNDPQVEGKKLMYNQFGLRRYSFQNYRIVCRIFSNEKEIDVILIQSSH